MGSLHDKPEWKRGNLRESELAQKLIDRGNLILPVYELTHQEGEEKAPRVFGARNLVTPDILAFASGEALWIESKAKSEPSWRRYPPGPRWEHGFDLYHFREYVEVQAQTRLRVFIVTHETRTPLSLNCDGLVDGDVWRVIRLDRLAAVGDERKDWPGGKAQPWRRGAQGMGGILWDVREMVEL